MLPFRPCPSIPNRHYPTESHSRQRLFQKKYFQIKRKQAQIAAKNCGTAADDVRGRTFHSALRIPHSEFKCIACWKTGNIGNIVVNQLLNLRNRQQIGNKSATFQVYPEGLYSGQAPLRNFKQLQPPSSTCHHRTLAWRAVASSRRRAVGHIAGWRAA